jgi:hypothetical protein
VSDDDTETTTETNDETDDTQDGEGRYDAEYVGKLRSEAAERRQKARQLEGDLERAHAREKALHARLMAHEVKAATAGVLADPDDLLLHVDAADLLDDDGDPDADKIAAAARDLAGRKPHLRPRTPSGDVDQGVRGKPAEGFDFAEILRSAAS